jgi:molybdopterin synthase sulfur carrier subunit
VDLRGGIKKKIGVSQLNLEEEEISISDMISYLEKTYGMNQKHMEKEIMIVINGVDASVLGGKNARICSGDIVTLLSVVHGG